MLQSVSSVFVVYRHKTLTGSPDPTHANGTDKTLQVQQQCQQEADQRQLFPHPLTQRFHTPVVPPVQTGNIQCPLQRQSYLQRSSQDFRRDPRFQHHPLQYS